MSERIETLAARLAPASRHALRAVLLDHSVEIVSCCFFKNAAPWDLPRRTCPDSFLLFPTKGRLRVILDTMTRELSPGEYLMLPEGCPHALALGTGARTLHQISIHCQIRDRWNRPLLSRFANPFGRLAIVPAHWFETLKDLACLTETETNSGLAQSFGETLLRALLAQHLKSDKHFDGVRAGGDPRIERALQVMDEQLGSPLFSIAELAHETGLSPARLRKLFRRDTGTGPKEYLTRARLRRARRLLRDPVRSVKQTARECGFASDHYFHLVFRKAYGCTPSEYRESRTV